MTSKKGYIYTMYKGADPGAGWKLNDPIYKPTPTLGACVPNIRKWVQTGDYIFTISGRKSGLQQYIVGGFEVDQKIDQRLASLKFPEYRIHDDSDGAKLGNVIVDAQGNRLPADNHSNWLNRLDDYVIGKDPIVLESEKEIEAGRNQTINILSEIFQKQGDTVHGIIGRCRKMNEDQIEGIIEWMRGIKEGAGNGEYRANT